MACGQRFEFQGAFLFRWRCASNGPELVEGHVLNYTYRNEPPGRSDTAGAQFANRLAIHLYPSASFGGTLRWLLHRFLFSFPRARGWNGVQDDSIESSPPFAFHRASQRLPVSPCARRPNQEMEPCQKACARERRMLAAARSEQEPLNR